MLTERQIACIEATGRAEMNPAQEARRHLKHLIGAIAYADDHFDKHGVHLRIVTDEAAAAVAVLDNRAALEPVAKEPAVNHPVIVALRWMQSLHGDAACMFGQSKHHPTTCAACNAKWILDCIENGGHPARVAAWTAKHPDLVPVTLAGLI